MGLLWSNPHSGMPSLYDRRGYLRIHLLIAAAAKVKYAVTCKTGGFPAVRHNKVRDITASLLSEVCHGATTEPHLQSLSGESMSHRSAITDDGARLDIAMYGFRRGRFEKVFLVSGCSTLAPNQIDVPL